jgi:ATP/ADP translocase/HEAT repeat protein
MIEAQYRILGLLAVRPGETARALLSFLYLFLIVASYVLMKAVRDALFISEFGALSLPFGTLGIAVVVGLFLSFYIRLARRLSSPRLVVGTLGFFCGNVLLFWWLALGGHGWLYPVIYVWAGLFGVVATTQVWTLANDLFTTREAKRLFGVVGAGGILGGATGGFLGALAPRLGTSNLLLIVTVLLAVAAGTVALLARHRTTRRTAAEELPRPQNLTQSLRLIAGSGHLRALAGLVFVTALATTMIYFQYALVAEQAIGDVDGLTAFFGTVFGSTATLAFLLQLLLTRRFLANLGVGVSILVLPMALLFGTIALMASASLWVAILLRGSDGTLKHSLDRSCRELMFLPLPSGTKVQTKSTIDTVMDRVGDGSAGLLQLLMTWGLGWGLRASLLVNGVAILVWVALARRVKGHYVGTLRSALRQATLRAPFNAETGDDADTREIIAQTLQTGTEVQKIAALEWVSQNPGLADDRILVDMVGAGEPPGVRQAALTALLGGREKDLPEEMTAGLEGEGHAALVSVIELLVEPETAETRERLQALIDGAGESARLPIVAFMVRRLGPEFEPFARRVFDGLLGPGTPSHVRRAAARTLALLPSDSSLRDYIQPLLQDEDATVAAAAAETAGRLGGVEWIPEVIGLLGRPGARSGAQRGLRHFGFRAVDLLSAILAISEPPLDVRRRIPQLLGEIGSPKAIAAVVRGLDDPNPLIRERCIVTLHQLRWSRADFRPLHRGHLAHLVYEECDRGEELLVAIAAVERAPGSSTAAGACLLESLHRERQAGFERIFRLLAMEYPVAEMDRTRRTVLADRADRRANALEYLDNTLSRVLKRRVLPLVEDFAGRASAVAGARRQSPLEEVLRGLAEGTEPWLGACALHFARTQGIPGLEGAAREAAVSSIQVLREEGLVFLREGAAP